MPLTSAECVQASKIVAADPTLRKLLAGRKYSVGRPDPWGAGDGVHNIGAVLKIQLAKPLSTARTVLPVANFGSGSSGTYTAGHLAVSLQRTTGLSVFVDLSRRKVVWVIPEPSESEGPPPTSIPPDTAPAGFVNGTGGASASDAARGLVVHLVTFDSTGRLVQEEWADPLTGKAVTNLYNPERKRMVRYVSVLTGKTLNVTTIADYAHTWTSGKGAIDTTDPGVLSLDSRTVPEAIRSEVVAGRLIPDGEQNLNGANVLRFHGKLGLIYFGLSFEAADGKIWVDPGTYLPIQQTLEKPSTGAAEAKTLFSWQPRSAVTVAAATAAVPKGYKHTPSTGLPHIFGD